jgi:hypothetical protein
VDHLGNDFFEFVLIAVRSFVIALWLIIGELDDLIANALAVLLDVAYQLYLLSFQVLRYGQLASRSKDLGKSRRLNFLHLFSAVFGAHELAHSSQTSTDG